MNEPITPAQERYLVRNLIPAVGKEKYRETKQALGIDASVTIPNLSKFEAGNLIRYLILIRSRPNRKRGSYVR